jgi:hypothetical protein
VKSHDVEMKKPRLSAGFFSLSMFDCSAACAAGAAGIPRAEERDDIVAVNAA